MSVKASLRDAIDAWGLAPPDDSGPTRELKE